MDLTKATEQQLREYKAPTPDSEDELVAIIHRLVERQHDYGTCVYAMSISATSAFNYVARKLGVSGFQASCADMDIVARVRGMKNGFRIIDYNDLLFPQYEQKVPGFWQLIEEQKEHLAGEARKLMAENHDKSHPDVKKHWEKLAAMHEPQPA